MLRHVLGFVEHQGKATHDLGYKLILTTNCDKSVLNKDDATKNCKNKISSNEWYVPHYTRSIY